MSKARISQIKRKKAWKHLPREFVPDLRKKLSEEDKKAIMELKGKFTQREIAKNSGSLSL